MRISDWSSDVCSSDLTTNLRVGRSNRSGRANVNPGRSMTCWGLCFLGANALFRAPSRRAHHDHADRPMHRRRPESHAIHTRSDEHTSELQSLMRTSYAVFFLKKKNQHKRL